jgi:hypothetical protein
MVSLFVVSLAAIQGVLAVSGSNTYPGSVATYTVPTAFPTSVYSSYYGMCTISETAWR